MSKALAAVEPTHLRRRLLPALLSASLVLPLGLALNYVMNVVLARVLPVEGYGLFAYVQSVASLLAIAAALGFSSSMMRLVATYRTRDERALLRGLLSSSFAYICLVSALLVVLLLIASWIWPNQRGGLMWSAILLIPLTVDIWRESTVRGLHRTAAAIIPRQVLLPLLTIILVVTFKLNKTSEILAAFAATLIIVEIYGLVQLRNAVKSLTNIRPRKETRQWLRISLPMGLSSVASFGLYRWDVVLLGLVVGLDAAGPYAAAARTALLASLVLRVVNLVIGPVLAELYHGGRLVPFKKLLVGATVGSGILGIPLYLLALLYPGAVLAIFGPAYQEAALPLQILATAQFINLATGPAGLALTMAKHEVTNLILTFLSATVSLVGLLTLVPAYGIVGAAIATAFASAVQNIGAALAAWWLLFRKGPNAE